MKNVINKKMFKRMAVSFMAVAMTFSALAGCQKKDDNNGAAGTLADADGKVYQAVFKPLNAGDGDYSIKCIKDGKMYATVTKYSDNYEENNSSIKILSADDMSEIKSADVSADFAANKDADCGPTFEGEYDESSYVNDMIVGEDGKVSLLVNNYFFTKMDETVTEYSEDDYQSNGYHYWMEYDADLNFISCKNITDLIPDGDEYSSPYAAKDAEGNYYIANGTKVRIFDKDWGIVKDTEIECQWYSGIYSLSGKVFVAYYDNDYNQNLVSVDAAGNVSKPYSNIPRGYNCINDANQENCIIIAQNEKAYLYNLETEEIFELFRWADVDINGDYVYSIFREEDGTIYAYTYDYFASAGEIAVIKLVDASSVAEKTEIVIASLSPDYNLTNVVAAYNKSQSKYHVTVKTYIDWERDVDIEDAYNLFLNDVTSNSDIDIINMSYIDHASIIRSGAVEDITPYINSSSVLSLDSFNEAILNIYRHDGKLYSIPRNFSIQTFAVSARELGDKPGWTLAEMIKYDQSHPDGELMAYSSRTYIEELCIAMNMDQFVNWETGECNFESQDFKNVLEYIKTFPAEIDYDAYFATHSESEAEMLANGKLLGMDVYIYDLETIQEYEYIFGGKVNFIGYPTVDGSPKATISAEGAYAIATNSKNKEAAWAFIEYYLDQEPAMDMYGLPANNKYLQEMIDKELAGKGEKTGSAVGWGDGEMYEYHYASQEEIDKIMEILNTAVEISSDKEIMNIISEETEAFYKGQKSVDDVCRIIQSRVSMYVMEHM